ncbi:fluoride efflux transporter FluC [Roseomonas marmotae]|uniref:Fluoride-specific ion channel FluC n=1 Tax=Roseomonas marmotae TaxID=2768161 RepID=A0ABS3KDH9_9PROT|nr:CrcB family protein [Roseomonas marmotae]MBO1075519.1 CrcB family protein [Roseomonas marmotae]QTI81512.1 CrcB family protein [Roseomonas marmotae]
MEAIDILWVGLGGGIGSLLRWQIGRVIDKRITTPFKFGTFFINVSGAFIIAYISTMLALGWEHRYGSVISSLVLTGVLGGYTTFSTMQLDAVQMTTAHRHGLAVIYLVTSVCAGLLAAAAGVALART